jgi:pimeloyl-ACP methyl ester carboxylesterase
MLAKYYQVIAPDIPFFGKSSTPRRVWDYEDYADFIAHFIDFLKLKKLTLVGHSFGGEIALRLTKKNLQIENLIVIGATGKPIRHPLLKLIYIVVWEKSRTNWKTYKDTRQTMLMRKDLINNIFKKFTSLIKLAKTVLRCIRSEMIFESPINVKTLFLWANNDELLFWSDEEKLISNFNNATVKKLDECHDWPVFKPEVLVENINNFIRLH